jgi:uncharacterized protein
LHSKNIIRLHVVDSLRGFALMGLFLVHMVSFYGLHWIQPNPSASYDVVMWLFGGKAYALFALLFGLSFYIIMDSQAKKGVDFRSRFCWRMTVLFGIGYLHSLFYSADILQILAVSGILLVMMHSMGNTILLAISLLFILQIPTYSFLAYLAYHPEVANSNPTFWALTEISNNVAATGSFTDVLYANALESHLGKWFFYLESSRLWNIIGLSMFGLWLGRIGFFTQFDEQKKRYVFVLLIGIIISFLIYRVAEYFNQVAIQESLVRWSAGSIIYSYLNLTLMMTAAILFVFCFQVNVLQRFLDHLAPCGRMTLTLYVAQSVIFTPIFFHYGLGLYDTISHNTAIILFVLLWVAQMLFANIWFRYFQYGPLEWIWRVTTFTRIDIPFRVKTAE